MHPDPVSPLYRDTISARLAAREAERRRDRWAPWVQIAALGAGFALAALGLALLVGVVTP